MRRALTTCCLLSMGLMAAACGNKGEHHDHGKSSAAQTSAPAQTAARATAAAQPAGPAKAPPMPAGRSTAPTLDEWARMTKEVTVKGSSALKCETKIVREYLRVSCRGKVDPEGEPAAIKILRGGRGEALTYAGPGVVSLVMPYVEGTDFEAVFSWTHKSHKLEVKWPRGSKQPVIVGVFEGAASPLDGTAKGDMEKLCECFKKVRHARSCEDMYSGADADCDRTYGNNCEQLLECSRGEPNRPPSCLPGFVNAGAMRRCYKLCTPGNGPCPAGHTCSNEWGVPICLEN